MHRSIVIDVSDDSFHCAYLIYSHTQGFSYRLIPSKGFHGSFIDDYGFFPILFVQHLPLQDIDLKEINVSLIDCFTLYAHTLFLVRFPLPFV